jgi:hypothetical protein
MIQRVSSINSGRKGLEQRTYQDDERIATLEQQLAEAQLIAEDSDRKYDEVIIHLSILEKKMLTINSGRTSYCYYGSRFGTR